jgi:uncharacterized membrane protein
MAKPSEDDLPRAGLPGFVERDDPGIQSEGAMRSTKSRIAHAISFEIIGLVLLALIGTWALDRPMEEIGTLAIVGATVAMIWTYLYNLLFDRVLLRLTGALRKPVWLRVIHSLLFEAGLLIVLLPYIMWHLKVGFIEALLLDLSMALFYVVYAFCFNWLFDKLFPVPDSAPQLAKRQSGARGGETDAHRAENCG